jgi:hypothetical protein
MVCNGISWLIAAAGLSLATFGQNVPIMAAIPSDPLEMVTGQIQIADTPASREAVLQLLERARNNYTLRSAGQGYDLKVSFAVNSGGQTEFDGAWEMEDVFDPKQGLRWTANTAAAYKTTQISSNEMSYREGTANYVPLRLHEARAALFDPIPSAANVARGSIRTSTAIFKGTSVTCVLLSHSGITATASSGRGWEETEECIDSESGLLEVHSQVPGRYYAYDYSNAPQLVGHVLPRKVIVTEAGKVVSEISVDSLTELPAADPRLFVATPEMKARGRAIAMAAAQKISLVFGNGPIPTGATAQPVCVFGLVTPSGQLVEAHSLQPSDLNSQAAVEAAKQMNFSPSVPPQQHFVFVIEKFVSSH